MPKILIVEDDEVIFSELVKLFYKNGYDTLDGLRQKESLSSDFDLALLDIELPNITGGI